MLYPIIYFFGQRLRRAGKQTALVQCEKSCRRTLTLVNYWHKPAGNRLESGNRLYFDVGRMNVQVAVVYNLIKLLRAVKTDNRPRQIKFFGKPYDFFLFGSLAGQQNANIIAVF